MHLYRCADSLSAVDAFEQLRNWREHSFGDIVYINSLCLKLFLCRQFDQLMSELNLFDLEYSLANQLAKIMIA